MRGSHAAAAQSDGVPGGLPGPAVLVVPSLYHALLGAPVHTQHERVWFGDNSFIGLLRRQPDQHDQSDIPGNFLGTSRGPSRSPCLTMTLSRPWDVLTLAERTNSRSVTSAEPRRHPTPAPHTHPTSRVLSRNLPARTAGSGTSDPRAQLTERPAPRPTRYFNTDVFPMGVCSLSLLVIS